MGTHSGSIEELSGWFAGRLPTEWFTGPIEVSADRDEILVTGTLADPDLPEDPTPETVEAARTARIDGFREDTRGIAYGSPRRPSAGSRGRCRGALGVGTWSGCSRRCPSRR